mgnify:CR=1 FL=1
MGGGVHGQLGDEHHQLLALPKGLLHKVEGCFQRCAGGCLGRLALVCQLLEEYRPAINTKGSGIGVRNVHQRIQLTFGRQYGLTIQSEPDEGTLVRIHLPALDEEASRPYRKEAGS